MNSTSSQPSIWFRWPGYVGVWVFLMVICAPQTFLGDPTLTGVDVFWIQVEYWTSWAIISPVIFCLCRRLYEGPRAWSRYMAGLLLGTVAVSLLHPLLSNSMGFARMWISWSLGLRPDQPATFLAKVNLAVLKNSGTNPFMFAVIAIAWHAVRHARDLRERQVRAIELESRLREAQLQALRSQLNPHFLFNTLHSIAELVHQNPHLAEQLILRLGELLRKVLASSGRPEVALAEEIEFIKAYLDIEQMRLGDRLRVEWDISPDALGVQVPSLVLQPLVENAIQHGIAALNRPGELRIRARRENGYLDLQVRDSGPGLQPRGDTTNPGIGLANTEARLRALFGDRHRFELINDSGLSVNLRLPVTATAS